MEGFPEFAKVVLLARFDLSRKTFDVRYINLDNGPGFTVLTDDLGILPESMRYSEEQKKQHLDELASYDPLFSALTALIYLPVCFATESLRVEEIEVTTKLSAEKADKKVTKAIKELRNDREFIWSRAIRCLQMPVGTEDDLTKTLQVPDLEFHSEGYWKSLPPTELGRDKEGRPIVGQTWVTRTDSWPASKPTSFLLERKHKAPTGPDLGAIYVVRCPGHEIDLYKIGLTRREVTARAKELGSATGVPLPFATLANWDVGDCGTVERLVHDRLAAYRVNPNREFFRAKIDVIIRVINDVVESQRISPKGC